MEVMEEGEKLLGGQPEAEAAEQVRGIPCNPQAFRTERRKAPTEYLVCFSSNDLGIDGVL